MRIVFFTESYKPYLSGVTVSLETLAKYLTLRGHRVWIVAPAYPGHKTILSKVIRLPSFPSNKYPGFRVAWPFFTRLFKKIKIIAPDIIHTHSPFTLGLLAKSYARRLNVPLVYSLHTIFNDYLHYFPLLPQKTAGWILEKYFRWFIKNLPVVVPTNFVKEMARQFAPEQLEVIPSGIDFIHQANCPKINLKEKLGIGPEKKILLYVGRLSKEKNIPFLLEVMSKISRARKDFHLWLVASGPEEKYLKEKAAGLNLNSFVTFIPQVSNLEIYSYYRLADIFVCASKTETQGIVLAEAMSCALPVVALDAKGVSDIIKPEAGFLVKDDVDLFAEKIVEISNNLELKARLGQGAAILAREKFSGEAMAKKMEELYIKLADK